MWITKMMKGIFVLKYDIRASLKYLDYKEISACHDSGHGFESNLSHGCLPAFFQYKIIPSQMFHNFWKYLTCLFLCNLLFLLCEILVVRCKLIQRSKYAYFIQALISIRVCVPLLKFSQSYNGIMNEQSS